MNIILQAAMMAAALIFITVSAMMNALFLSSLGRTALEVGLLAAISLAGDITKVVLPVVIMRAVMLRAWGQAGCASIMLAFAIALSLASGTGFVALTRGSATAAREAQAERLSGRLREAREIDRQLAILAPARPYRVIDADLDGAMIDRRWIFSKSCIDISSQSVRHFCSEVFRLRAERTAATEAEKLQSQREALREQTAMLQSGGVAGDSDPQIGAIADLLGIDRKLPRLVLSTAMAIMLELGSVTLVLLAVGPTLWGWREPGAPSLLAPDPAKVPEQSDRSYWQRQRTSSRLTSIRRADRDE